MAEEINRFAPETITCYTDGSKSEQGDTGYGYIITTENNRIIISKTSAQLPPHCSVYQAELSAITEAVKELIENQTTNKVIVILTDSDSAIQTLNNKLINSLTAKRCHAALQVLSSRNTVTVKWVEAHKGHWGNEEADKLAKAGTISDIKKDGCLPQSYIKLKINETVREMDKSDWSITDYRHTNLTLGPNSKTTAKDMKSLEKDRNKYRAAVQLISGHIALNGHLHKMQLEDTKTCPLCEMEDETTNHFLGTCPALAQLRGEIFNKYYASISDIFEEHRITEIARYAAKSKRFLEYKGPDPGGGLGSNESH